MNVCLQPCPVVFDLDGTLIDSAPDIHACVNSVLDQHGVDRLTLQQVRSFIGGGVDALWQKIILEQALAQGDREQYVAAFMTCYQDANKLTRLYPNVVEALHALSDRGHPLGLCTNKPHAVTTSILEHFGLDRLFACVIGGDSVPERKPHPAPLRAAFAGLGAHPQQPKGLYVGDSEFDAACASAVPVPFLLYTEGYRQSAVKDLQRIDSFSDFLELPHLVEFHVST